MFFDENRTLKNIEKLADKILDDLLLLEDITNYDVKSIGKAVDIMQKLDLKEEFKKHNV